MIFYVVIGVMERQSDPVDEDSVRVFSSRDLAEFYGELLMESGEYDSYMIGERVLDSVDGAPLEYG